MFVNIGVVSFDFDIIRPCADTDTETDVAV